jgi:hypothetical protein
MTNCVGNEIVLEKMQSVHLRRGRKSQDQESVNARRNGANDTTALLKDNATPLLLVKKRALSHGL